MSERRFVVISDATDAIVLERRGNDTPDIHDVAPDHHFEECVDPAVLERLRAEPIRVLAALGHIRQPNGRCTARYAEVPKEARPPGPASPPVWCYLPAGHEGPHKCNSGGMHMPFVMRPEHTVEGEPLPDLCAKCGTRWPCPAAQQVGIQDDKEPRDGR